ncbi:MAG TPA: extracellular solute-binding protein [Lamprocystis sp. (in: g-proteobacteria)]|nr:extracellular solute-binding protein [Lamprocystis sp. (in: g-proteobacteria)]
MPKFTALRLTLPALLAGILSATATVNAEETVHLYNWNDYFAEDTLQEFQKQTGIRPILDLYDNNDILEAKLLAGSSGYDVVFPTARPFGARHIKAGIYQPLDKAKLAGLDQMDPAIMAGLKELDPDNARLVPYLLGTTGIGVNVAKVKEALGEDAPTDSWAILFDPKLAAKLKGCGISMLDDATEAFSAALAYLGKDPNSRTDKDLAAAAEVLKAARPNIRYFHSSQYISDLANGDLCVAHGYSGDILQAKSRAEEAAKGVQVGYHIPKEGAVLATDVMAIPKDAPNPAAANAFIAFILQPAVIARITDYVKYANANTAATPLVSAEVRDDPGIYPPAAVKEKFVVLKTPTDKEQRKVNNLWTRIKAER